MTRDSILPVRGGFDAGTEHETDRNQDLFWDRLDQIINMRHELVLLAQRIDWDWIDAQLSEAFSAKGRSATETRFMIGLLLLKQLYDLLARRYAGAGRTIPISST